MKKFSVLFLVVLAALLPASQALAQPGSGFGLFGGVARHDMEGTFTQPPLTGIQFNYESSGVSIGIDWQFEISDSFTINPFLMSSSESFSGDINADGGHAILGVSFRFWFDGLFLGPHVGSYNEVLEDNTGNTIDASGTGIGVMIGWQDESGFLLMAQYDTASLEYVDADVDLTGIRLQAGFRWK